jgi:hypothetical protein
LFLGKRLLGAGKSVISRPACPIANTGQARVESSGTAPPVRFTKVNRICEMEHVEVIWGSRIHEPL